MCDILDESPGLLIGIALDRWYVEAEAHAADYESCLAQGGHAKCGLQLFGLCFVLFL